jgi:pyrroline-5-carboxylate reductase
VSIAAIEAAVGRRGRRARAGDPRDAQHGERDRQGVHGALGRARTPAPPTSPTARTIFECVGTCLELDERHLDAVTAVSASGPAFLYVVLEALTDGAVSCGLPRAAATELVTRMTLGAAEMVLTTASTRRR